MEREIWLTALFNRYLAGPADTVLSWVGVHPHDPAHPWTNWLVMEILVVAILVLLTALLRPRLSVDNPGKLQHIFELIYEFIAGQAENVIGERGRAYLAFFGTMFIFILSANLIGMIPTLESPTMFAPVPLGCALATFAYYNVSGVRAQGVGHYLKHFAGPMPALAPLMFPVEVMSNLARPLSLTIRLYANMFAGERVTMAFMSMVPLVVPLPFMGLHIFVAFLQAYIFTLLTMIYLSGALPEEQEHS